MAAPNSATYSTAKTPARRLGRHCLSLKTNEAWLEKNGNVSDIHHKKPTGRPMSEAASRANGLRSKIGAFVENVFARQKTRMGMWTLLKTSRRQIGTACWGGLM